MYHGCIPMDEDGNFENCTVNGITASGKAYMDYLDTQLRNAYFNPDESEETGRSGDLMWYLWLGSKSPLFGKDQMTTFERCFVADKRTHKEYTVSYYKLINRKDICEKILTEFGLDPKTSIILNGHVPVKIKDGESPVKGGGKLIVIDGGMSKAYQKQTGIAGYTFIFNSRYMALAEHKPYSPLKKDGTQEFHTPAIRTVRTLQKKMCIRDRKIENLTGGHSGGDIHKARGNANELFWRTLSLYEKDLDAELVSIEGGTSRVAIPRETKGVILIDEEQAGQLEELTFRLQNEFRSEYQVTAPELNVKIRPLGPYKGKYMYHPSLRKLLKLVYLVPNGIMEMNGALDMKGLVESSINQGVMRAGDNFFVLVGEIRYSHISSRNFIIEKIMALSELLEAKVCLLYTSRCV